MNPRIVDQPEPGFFTTRLVRNGPLVPARIIWHEGEGWQAVVNGEPGPTSYDDVVAGVDLIWNYCPRISEAEYEFMLAVIAWAEEHEPRHPAANPRRPIDPRTKPFLAIE